MQNDAVAPRPVAAADAQLRSMAAASRDRQWAIFFEMVDPAARQERVTAIAAEVRTPQLPTCTGFTGTGSRCTSCRIRKALHA